MAKKRKLTKCDSGNPHWDDPLRGTGRTTGRMLLTLGFACLQPGTWIEFEDNEPMDRRKATSFRSLIEGMIKVLELCGPYRTMEVRTHGSQLFVRSLVARARKISRSDLPALGTWDQPKTSRRKQPRATPDMQVSQ